MRRSMLSVVVATGAVLLAGCGASPPNCAETTVLSVGPASATASAAAAAPGNQVQFEAVDMYALVDPSARCALPALAERVFATWTNPDTTHISISSANDVSNGLAVCKGPTAGAVTLTATSGSGSTEQTATAQLTCQ